MSAAAATATLLYPPTVTPPSAPLPLGKFVYSIIRNPLSVLPQGAYEEPIFGLERKSRYNAFWVMAPELVEDILIKRSGVFLKTPLEKRVFRRTLKDGVLSADGPLWRWQRRIMAPLFRPVDVLGYVPSMAQPAEELLAEWRAATPGSVQRVDDAMTEATFAVIARTMLKGGEPSEAETIKHATAVSLAHISWDMMYGALNVPVWMPHPWSWALSRSARRLRGAVEAIIRRRQRDGGGGTDLLGRLLDARDPDSGEPMEMERLINNLLTLLEAGHETTAKGLTWTLYLLARAPEWQEQVRAEIANICGEGHITAEHIGQLSVTQQVLKESMRLYPPVPVVSRVVTQDTELAGKPIPKGAMAIVPIYCIHRHKMLWSDPGRFDPTRFTPEKEASYSRTQFMPFGAGPRVCIGNSFAMTEATVILASLIRAARFDWDGRTLPEPISRVTLQPKGGMPLKVTMLSQKPLSYVA
jgi:cytochrome P450